MFRNSTLYSLTKVEAQKLLKKRSSKVLIGFYLFAVFALILFYILAEITFGFNLYTGGQFVNASLANMMNFMLPLTALYLGAGSMNLDFRSGTIKNMYLLPVSREAIYIGKILSVQGILGSLLLLQWFIATLTAWIVEGSLNLSIGNYFGAFFIVLLINMLAMSLSLFLKNVGLVILLAYGAYIGITLISFYLPAMKVISPAYVIGNYGKLFSLGAIPLLLTVLAYYIISFVTGLLLFEKKDENLCQFD
ncbi:MAG: ABC transporter permease [Vallitaleaceae bacterium]|nr:ABC transporter permease [Vallitaleaceae bacterium]